MKIQNVRYSNFSLLWRGHLKIHMNLTQTRLWRKSAIKEFVHKV